ncbi:hypothetical protein COO60DRAFT_1701307 [Scenedesmus sp. NREL 46B-D3]|nr:hypothetical protein COO60DRAFT_1701307 [Scenedesmus sp. NREL 46B-D3]
MHVLQPRSMRIAYKQQARAAASSRKALTIVAKTSKGSSAKPSSKQVSYGKDWYEQTRNAAKPARTVREELEYRREANRLANNGRERKDLYTANWDGSEYKGSKFNILTVIALVSVLTPLLGLAFAYATFGVLWG